MNCDEVRDLLSPMTDREVSPEALKEVEEHLRTCKDCAFQSTMMVGMKNLLQRWDGVQPSNKFRTGVLEKVQTEPPPGLFSRITPTVWGSVVAAIATIGLVMVFVLTGDGETPPSKEGDGPDAGGAEPRVVTPPANASTDPVAQVSFTKGAVHLTPPGDASALGSAGDVLAPGYKIRVTKTGSADLLIVGGFEMRLEKAAELVFGSGAAPAQLGAGRVLIRSSEDAASFEAVPLSCGGAHLKIGAGPVAFSCERLADETVRVIAAEGSLTVLVGENAHSLGAGKMVEISASGEVNSAGDKADATDLAHLKRWVRR